MVRKAAAFSKVMKGRKCGGRQLRGKGKYVCTEQEEEEEEEEDDIISLLPDEIISHILTFLPLEEVVQTSGLSKRWRYVWTSVPTIKITAPLSRKPEVQGRFMDFIDRVLRLNDVHCLQKFSLACGEEYNLSRVIEWINAITIRNVKDIDLNFYGEIYTSIELPPMLFTSNKLVVLKLSYEILLDVPKSAYLPSLEILHLVYVNPSDTYSVNNLLEACPVLRELDIGVDPNYAYKMDILFVRSSSLKFLKIDYQGGSSEDTEIGIMVDATNLERLDLTCYLTPRWEVNGSSSLVEVKLDLFYCNPDLYFDLESDFDSESVGADFYCYKLVELLKKMSNAKYMSLSCDTMTFLDHACLDSLPVFYNLTRLELHINEHSWQTMSYMLQCSPFIVTFVLATESGSHLQQHQHFFKPKCLMSNLEEIELKEFRGCEDGMEMVSYFLKNATILKKMSIWSYYSGSKNEEILKKLIMFPRSSSACQIAFE